MAVCATAPLQSSGHILLPHRAAKASSSLVLVHRGDGEVGIAGRTRTDNIIYDTAVMGCTTWQ